MPGVSGVTVTTCVRATLSFARKTAGASGARHSLRPLIFRWRESFRKTRTHRAARTRWCVFSRSLKIESGMVRTPHQRRPGEGQDPYAVARVWRDAGRGLSRNDQGLGLWVLAFARTTPFMLLQPATFRCHLGRTGARDPLGPLPAKSGAR